MSDTSIMSVGDLIDSAFGDPDVNTVNFKLIQTVLLLIARQLSILERFVAVKIGYPIVTNSGSRLSIREVKLHAVVPKKEKKKRKDGKSSGEKEYFVLDETGKLRPKGQRREEDTTPEKSTEDKSYKKKGDKRREKEKLNLDEDYSDERRSVSSKGKYHMGETAKHKGEIDSDTEYEGKSSTTRGKSPEGKKYSTKVRDEDEEEELRELKERRESKEREGKRSTARQSRDGPYRADQSEDDSPNKSSKAKSPRDKSAYNRSPTSTPSAEDERYEKESWKYSSPRKSRDDKTADGRSVDKSEDRRKRGQSEDGRRGDKPDTKYDDNYEDSKRKEKPGYGRSLEQFNDDRKRDRYEDGRRGDKSEYSRSEDRSKDGRRAEKSDKYSDKSGKSRSRSDKYDTEKGYDKKSEKNAEDDFGSSGISLESEQQSVDKRSYDKQDSRGSKRPTDKKVERRGAKADKASIKGADSRVSSSATTDSKRKKYQQLLEKLEEERERVLRVIHQRADSHEEHSKSPTPMASLSSTDLQQEKLLIVEKISSDKASKNAESSKSEKRTKSRMSVVTQDQFQQLTQTVKDLEEKFGPLDFPFIEDLRQGVPISDALAGLQLASRLEATEKALGQMINIVTDIAVKTPGVNVKSFTDLKDDYGGTVTKLRQTESQYKFRAGATPVLRVEIGDKPEWVSNTGVDTESKIKTIGPKPSETVSVVSAPISVAAVDAHDNTSVETGLWDVTKKNFITAEEMENAIKGVYEDYTTILTNWTNRTSQKADEAYHKCTKMESELAKTLAVENKMNDLEEKIQSYVERINILDTGLSTQMINYQEQLTQMQHDLETGLDNMAEALATQTGDTEAMAEMNQNFTILQSDFDRTRVMQKDLADIQEAFAIDLTALKKQIEMLREVKSDRDEVTDALRDKAGLSALNGLVNQMQFDAVQGDLEKRIRHAYDKFNSQEVVWQKAIDDLIREINEKATVQQVDSLREEIQSNINVLKEKIDYMSDILGEPTAVAIKRQLFRDTECLSCSTPAKMKMEEPGEPGEPGPVGLEPTLSYKKSAGEDTRLRRAVGDGDHVPCIPGLPPPHPIDPRAEFCTRYCGGRIFSQAYNRMALTQLPSINISQLTRETRTAMGDDGKVYQVGFEVKKKPCHPCNVPKTPAKDDHIPEREKISRKSSSTMGTPSDLRVYSELITLNRQRDTDTPPASIE